MEKSPFSIDSIYWALIFVMRETSSTVSPIDSLLVLRYSPTVSGVSLSIKYALF
jgi:hypothetical protein